MTKLEDTDKWPTIVRMAAEGASLREIGEEVDATPGAVTPADFTLSAVPLRGPLAPLAVLWGLAPEGFDEEGYYCRAVDLTRPEWRSVVVAWLEEQGYTAAYRSDEALLIALRHVCGLPPAPPSVDDFDDDDIPF